MNNNCNAFVMADNNAETNYNNGYAYQFFYFPATTFMPPKIRNPELARMRKVTCVTYSILLATAPIFFITYAVLWSQIQPPLNLLETGNGWTFIYFLSTCLLTTIFAIVIVTLCARKFPLKWNHVVWFDILLVCCYTGLLMVVIGTMEQAGDRSLCNRDGVKCSKHYAPKVPTTFGNYVAGVCGKNLTESDLKGAARIIPPMPKDSVRCEATKVLKTEIFCMYAWAVELIVLTLVELLFGVGNFKNKDPPEFI